MLIVASVGSALGVVAVLLSWLIGSETSPCYQYFLENVTVKNIWMVVNFPAFMVLILTGARSFAIGALLIFFQWLLIGFLASFVFLKVKGTDSSPNLRSGR